MEFNVTKIFDGLKDLSSVRFKVDYESYTKHFKENGLEELSKLWNSEETIDERCTSFVKATFDNYEKRGKIRGSIQMSLNYFAIYYIFPTILDEAGEDAKLICDTLRDNWNSAFKTNINYTDYKTLYDGFQMKIFGFPIPEKDKN